MPRVGFRYADKAEELPALETVDAEVAPLEVVDVREFRHVRSELRRRIHERVADRDVPEGMQDRRGEPVVHVRENRRGLCLEPEDVALAQKLVLPDAEALRKLSEVEWRDDLCDCPLKRRIGPPRRDVVPCFPEELGGRVDRVHSIEIILEQLLHGLTRSGRSRGEPEGLAARDRLVRHPVVRDEVAVLPGLRVALAHDACEDASVHEAVHRFVELSPLVHRLCAEVGGPDAGEQLVRYVGDLSVSLRVPGGAPLDPVGEPVRENLHGHPRPRGRKQEARVVRGGRMLLADAVIRSHSLDKFVVPSKQVVRATAFSEGRAKEVGGDRNALRHPGFQRLPLGNTVECLLRPRRDNGLVQPVRLRVDPEKDAPVRLSCEAERLAHDGCGR